MHFATIPVFSFSELSMAASQRAATHYLETLDFTPHAEALIEDATEIGRRMGIEIDRIDYAGFGSQGDGARFIGRYTFAADAVSQLRDWCPTDERALALAERLAALQSYHGGQLAASVGASIRCQKRRRK